MVSLLRLRLLALGGLLICLAACDRQPEAAAIDWPHPVADASRRDTAQGPVVGFADADATYGWMGIPFARPPVGELRWRAPQPPATRTGVLQATAPGGMCVYLNPLNEEHDPAQNVGGSEDCLYLNIWAPREVPAAGLPVMVWIHGGANVVGTANSYTTLHELAGRQQVVVVSLNYRLGVLGWFNHPALATGDPLDDSGNYATLDLVAGLRWVQENIAQFGGDPQRVTIFGESAGGANVLALLTATPARGLFHGAIAQSGLAASVPVELAREGLPAAARPADDPGRPTGSYPLVDELLVRAERAATTAEARALQQSMPPAELSSFLRGLDVQALFRPLHGERIAFSDATYKWLAHIADGSVMPGDWMLQVFAQPEQVADVPLLIGSNRDEMRLFQFMDPDYVRLRLGFLPRMQDETRYLRDAAYGSDLWRAVGVIDPVQGLAEARGDRLFVYRFDWDDLPSNWLADMKTLLGAAHGFDIGFITGAGGDLVERFRGNTAANAEGRQQLSAAMRSYWAQFAYSGAPGRGRDGSLPLWHSWRASGGQSQILDTEGDGGIRTEPATVTVAEVRERLLTDPTLSDAERCDLHRQLFAWHFAVSVAPAPLPGCQ